MIGIIIDFLTKYLIKLFFALIDNSPDWFGKKLYDRLFPEKLKTTDLILVDPSCGDHGIDLQENRLLISSAFGSYFTSLLERDQSYINLKGQIYIGATGYSDIQDPFQRIYWAFEHSRGPQIIILAGQGGMGKSTLAAKIIRCLYSQKSIDVIIGDSAKTQEVDPVSGSIRLIDPTYYNIEAFVKRMNRQLGLPLPIGRFNQMRMLSTIKDRLEGRRTIIAVDNLETVAKGADFLNALRYLAGRDIRILVTTRTIVGLSDNNPGFLLVRLQPLKDILSAQDFIRWHIKTHSVSNPDLPKIMKDLNNRKNIEKLLVKTGGIPLLMQLLVSDIVRTSWDRLDRIPQLFGKELLDFLYRERWSELEKSGNVGKFAQGILLYVQSRQFEGKKITINSLLEWAKDSNALNVIQESIRMLEQQFLLMNSDRKSGNYSILPSLSDYLIQKVNQS